MQKQAAWFGHGRSITTAHPLSHSVTPSFDNFSPGGSRAADRISITKSNGILVLFQTWPLWRRITSGFYKTSICNVCVLSLSHPISVNWRTKKWVPTVNQLWDKDSFLYWDHAVHLFRAPVVRFFIMSTEFDKNISDWSYDCTDHKNSIVFFMRLFKWLKIDVKKCQNLTFKVDFQYQKSFVSF